MLSMTSEYALSVMAYLAGQGPGFCKVPVIAKSIGHSEPYAFKVVTSLESCRVGWPSSANPPYRCALDVSEGRSGGFPADRGPTLLEVADDARRMGWPRPRD
jgi:hypothetical protein